MREVQLIAEMADEGRADQILQAFLNQETRLADPQILDKVIAHFEMDLEIPDAKTVKAQKHAAIASIDIEGLRAVAAALDASGVDTHKRRAAQMSVWLAQTSADRIENYLFLLTRYLLRTGRATNGHCQMRIFVRLCRTLSPFNKRLFMRLNPFCAEIMPKYANR